MMLKIVHLLTLEYNLTPFSFFANYYRDGNDYAPYHRDKYGFRTLTLSFGGSRDFYFKHDKTRERIDYRLDHGDLILFEKDVNDAYKHSIPRRKNLKSDRISILFFLKD